MELSINNLCDKIVKKKIVLPNFQREFVWKVNQQKGLIASIFTGVPCTSSLIVEENDPSAPKFPCKDLGFDIIHAPFNPTDFPIQYLLDGQQRYTTIYFVFKDVYSQFSNFNDKLDYSKKIYEKLKNRWFIKIDNDCFGCQNLFFEEENFNNKIPSEIIDLIDCVSDIEKDKCDLYIGKKTSEIADKCIEKKYLPLFWLLDNPTEINRILSSISKNKLNGLLSDKDYDKLKDIFSINSISNFDQLLKALTFAKNKFEEQSAKDAFIEIFNEISNSWSTKIFKCLSDKVNKNYINTIVLQDINKAIATFGNINNSGTKLSTFDLICSKSKIDLRKNLFDNLEVEFEIDGKLVILDDSFKLYESGTGLNTQFLDFFIHVFNIVHFVKDGSLPPIKFPDSSILKQVYSLKNLESDFIDSNYLDVLLYSKITCYILNNKLGHIEFKSVTNKLSLIPIVYYVIIKEGKLTTKEIDKISTFFWITLFSGKYSKDQNEQSIRDCANIYKFVSENEKSYLNGLLQNDFFKIKDFATEISLCDMTVDEKVNLNAENNLVHYLLSKSLNDFCHPSKMIDINSDIIELHHIIPLASVKTVGSSTKQIRNGKHILNSVMNLTPISKDSNRAISSLEIKKYQTELSDVTISTHHLSNEWRSIQFDGSNNSDIIRLFKNRFQNINSQMLRDFDKIIRQ